ncbi:MAG: hypothetical protein Q7T34_00820 [Candidatus Parcubacteria bacterium]|nr:hypothetical protein [Candidatus Parcubacteria bacterium]
MIAKFKEKEIAINLRRKGLSYNEILRRVPVAKSSLSLWLKSVGLAKKQKQRLTEKKLAAGRRGGEARRNKRLISTALIKDKAKAEIKNISKRELWLMGIMLHWAEGAKEKQWNTGVGVDFNNSDPLMISLFLRWLKEICFISEKNIIYDLYIHETADWKNARQYWSKVIKIHPDNLRIYFKKNKIHTKRKNRGSSYHGLIRIKIRRSTDLNRKISGWIEGICKHCGVV